MTGCPQGVAQVVVPSVMKLVPPVTATTAPVARANRLGRFERRIGTRRCVHPRPLPQPSLPVSPGYWPRISLPASRREIRGTPMSGSRARPRQPDRASSRAPRRGWLQRDGLDAWPQVVRRSVLISSPAQRRISRQRDDLRLATTGRQRKPRRQGYSAVISCTTSLVSRCTPAGGGAHWQRQFVGNDSHRSVFAWLWE